jgi:hypothetical protein
MRFLDVAKCTTLTPLSLLISCKRSFPIVGLKMFSLPTLAFKSPNKIFMWSHICNSKQKGRRKFLQSYKVQVKKKCMDGIRINGKLARIYGNFGLECYQSHGVCLQFHDQSAVESEIG